MPVTVEQCERKIEALERQINSLKSELTSYREEVLALTRAELEALDEYSCTLPTGTRIGKRWRRDNNEPRRHQILVAMETILPEDPRREKLKALLDPPEWWLGEYVEHKDPDKVGIRWTRIAVKDTTT